MLDGYGLPFDEEAQKRYLEYIIAAEKEYRERPPPPLPPEPEWKDKPAGWRHPESKRSGV